MEKGSTTMPVERPADRDRQTAKRHGLRQSVLLPARLVAALRPESTSRLELPTEFIQESRHRVRVAALIGAAAYLVFLVFELSGVQESSALERGIDRAHDVIAIALCVALYAIASLRALPDRVVLRVSLGAEFLLCALISLAVPWAAFVHLGQVQTLTWVIPIIILFALLVPARRRTALIVTSLCAATMPGGLWILASAGKVAVRTSDYWSALLSGAVAVGIASVASRTVSGVGRQLAAAKTVGSYELLEPIGEGGMGQVWKARHLLLARPAAVKLILPERLQGPTEERDAAVQRFVREARVTAELRSPHTVQLFDFGLSAGGELYYAMELLDGMNAEHFVRRFGPVEPRRAVDWLAQACHSLGEAHAAGLVHRDVKPANLYLCRYGRDVDFVKILDFGLTKLLAQRGDPSLSTPSTILGTPSYMAPEQVFGLEVGPRTDLYLLGCVGYWLLSGTKPFEGVSAGELMRQHAQIEPPPLGGRAPCPLPHGLEAVIMACLSKDAAGRPADADELSERLTACIEGNRWTPGEAQAWWREHPMVP